MCASQLQMAHRNASRGRSFCPPPLRLPRPLPSRPPGASPCHRPSRGRRRRSPLLLAAGTCTSGRSPVHPSALLRCLAVRRPSTQGQRQRFAPECGGRRNQRDSPTPAHSEVGCDETDLNPQTPHHRLLDRGTCPCPSLACPLGGPAGPTLAVGHRRVGVQRGHAGFLFLGSDERPPWMRGATGASWLVEGSSINQSHVVCGPSPHDPNDPTRPRVQG